MDKTRIHAYQNELLIGIDKLNRDIIEEAAQAIFEAWQSKAFVWIFGNGGSASTAEHFACDLSKWTIVYPQTGVRAMALTSHPLVTAFANDENYDKVFIRQLDRVIDIGDVAIGISCSGRSANVLAALSHARERGNTTIALTGNDKNVPILENADFAIHASCLDIRQQEDVHLIVAHMIVGLVKDKIQKCHDTTD